jgi:hypothetical protein
MTYILIIYYPCGIESQKCTYIGGGDSNQEIA